MHREKKTLYKSLPPHIVPNQEERKNQEKKTVQRVIILITTIDREKKTRIYIKLPKMTFFKNISIGIKS